VPENSKYMPAAENIVGLSVSYDSLISSTEKVDRPLNRYAAAPISATSP
jgi:hypothetical protein